VKPIFTDVALYHKLIFFVWLLTHTI